MKVRLLLSAVLAAALVVPVGAPAQQKYPVKSVCVVLPFATGSAVDLLARLYAQRMTESWGQQVVVENRTGANGIIGMESIARAAPDGYTIGVLAPRVRQPTSLRKSTPRSMRISQLPDTRERLGAAGFEVVGSSPEAFATLIKNDTARLGKVIRDAGIRAE